MPCRQKKQKGDGGGGDGGGGGACKNQQNVTDLTLYFEQSFGPFQSSELLVVCFKQCLFLHY